MQFGALKSINLRTACCLWGNGLAAVSNSVSPEKHLTQSLDQLTGQGGQRSSGAMHDLQALRELAKFCDRYETHYPRRHAVKDIEAVEDRDTLPE